MPTGYLLMNNPIKFTLSTDFSSLANPDGQIIITVNVPSGAVIPAGSQLVYSGEESVTDDTAQYVMGKVYSSSDPNNVLLVTGNNPGGNLRFDRSTYFLYFYVVSDVSSVSAYVLAQNKRSDVTRLTGSAETITFELRPLGKLF